MVCRWYLLLCNAPNCEELLQFLSRDAKIPLAVAMSYVPKLKSSKLMRYTLAICFAHGSAKAIADLKKGGLDTIISEGEHRKAITNAAKRVLKVLSSWYAR